VLDIEFVHAWISGMRLLLFAWNCCAEWRIRRAQRTWSSELQQLLFPSAQRQVSMADVAHPVTH
jgi:hypothetical protein